ncbi:MAG: restriction endonuclease subunit S [Bacteroidetes bacterium]|jgi:type I restriction enzyme S subunit|nr:restriction endonuclease subunit S [Bacteroidota bacterium]
MTESENTNQASAIKGFAASTKFRWPLVKNGEVVSLHYGKSLVEDERRPGSVPVYGTNGITGWHDEALADGPTVVLGRKGMGNLGVEWCEDSFWVIDTAYYTTFDHSHILPRFFYYFTDYTGLNHLKVGTSNPSLQRDVFSEQLIPLPPLPIQRRIADILGALDDKIELNRQMNETLEAMAQALYQHWFVDFGPFQDGAFVDSELGPIPEGWTTLPLDEVANFLNGTAWGRYKPESDDEATLQVIKIRELRGGFDEKSDLVSEKQIPDKYVVRDGDVIFSWSGSLLLRLWSHGRGALNQHLFKVTSERFPKWFYYQGIRHHIERFRRIAEGKATTMGHIKRSHLSESQVAVPPTDVMREIHAHMEPLMSLRIANMLEARTLAETRDYLLPKLISGEIPVDAAEEQAGVAA